MLNDRVALQRRNHVSKYVSPTIQKHRAYFMYFVKQLYTLILKKDDEVRYGVQANCRLQQTNDCVKSAHSEPQPRALGGWKGAVEIFGCLHCFLNEVKRRAETFSILSPSCLLSVTT